MSPYTRRRALQLMSANIPLGIAGCVYGRSTTDTRLGAIYVQNGDQQPHTVRVEVTEGDESVYERTVDVQSGNVESTEYGEERIEDHPTDSGAFVVHAWRDDQSREDRRTSDLRDWEVECAVLIIRIGNLVREDNESRVSIWKSFDCEKDNY